MNRWFFICLLCCTVWGCTAVKGTLNDYDRCASDLDCMAEIQTVKDSTYMTTKMATSSIPIGVPDIIALVVSNIASFGVGVVKGRRKKG